MCAAMFARAIAWHAILSAAPPWRRAKRPRRDAGHLHRGADVLDAARAPGRALARADRRAAARAAPRDAPVVLGTMVSQTLLNLLALAPARRRHAVEHRSARRRPRRPDRRAFAPVAGLLVLLLGARAAAVGLRRARARAAALRARRCAARWRGCATACALFRRPRAGGRRDAAAARAPGRCSGSAAGFVLMALGLDARAGVAGAAAVLFAVNVDRRAAGDSGQLRRLPGGVRGRARRRLPRLHARSDRLRHRAAGDRARRRGADGAARARQRGALLARGAPAHDARRARQARPAALGAARRRRSAARARAGGAAR